MRGTDWISLVEQTSQGTGWLGAGIGSPLRSPLPEYLEGDQETAAAEAIEVWLSSQGGPGELLNLGKVIYRMGASFGWPGQRWGAPAVELFQREMLPSVFLPSVSGIDLSTGAGADDYLRQAWSVLSDSGMADTWASFTGRFVGSYAEKIGTNIPILNLLVAIGKVWVRAIRGRIASIGVPDYSSIPSVQAWQQRSGAIAWNNERDQTEADSIASLVDSGGELTPLFLPRATEAEATTVAMPDGTGAFYLGIRSDSPSLADRNTGYAPGTDMVIRGYQNPVWTGEWVPTGTFALTARSMCSQLWQLVASGHPIQGAVNLVGIKNDWRRYTRSLAAALLRPYDWLGNPIPPRTGNFPDWRGHASTLRTLWNQVAGDVGWPDLNKAIAQTKSSLNLNVGTIVTDEVVDKWAFAASRAIDTEQQGFSDFGVQGLVENSTMVRAVESLQDDQRANFRSSTPVLLPYVPTDAAGIPLWPGARMTAAQRLERLTDLVNSPQVCEVDAADIPDGPDAAELRDAVKTRQSGCQLGLAARPSPPPPLVVGGELAAAGGGSGLPGWLLASLGIGGLGFWIAGRRGG